jgi:hypothetical protein
LGERLNLSGKALAEVDIFFFLENFVPQSAWALAHEALLWV